MSKNYSKYNYYTDREITEMIGWKVWMGSGLGFLIGIAFTLITEIVFFVP